MKLVVFSMYSINNVFFLDSIGYWVRSGKNTFSATNWINPKAYHTV